MTGLILKDFLGLRKVLKICLFILALYAALMFAGVWTAPMTAGFFSVVVAMLPLSCFNMDQMSKWESYGAALPVSRNQTVAARYLTLLIMLGVVALADLAMAAVTWVIEGREEALSALLAGCVCLSLAAVLNAVVLPLIYKSGAERGRIIFSGALLGAGGLAVLWLMPMGGAAWLVDLLSRPGERHMAAPALLFAAVCLLLLIPSCAVSCAIYKNKEF